MQVITAALAFAIIMLILSMITSTLVEMIHRLIGMREKGLYYMVGQLFDHVLVPYAKKAGIEMDADALAKAKEAFQHRMTANRSPVGVMTGTEATKSVSTARGWDSANLWKWVVEIWRGRGLSNLSATGFMERLGSDSLGDAIVKVAGDAKAQLATDANKALEVVLQDVAQKFEVFSNEASVFFERRARLFSVLVAIVVAFALYVNAIEIFKTFMRDPTVAENVVKLQEGTLARYEASLTQKINAAPNDAAALEKLKQDSKALTESVKQNVAQLSDLGVPIGWTEERKLFANPWGQIALCRKAGQPDKLQGADQKCASGETPVTEVNGWPSAVGVWLSVLLGGLLIGLGGPFWYDAIKSLTGIRNVGRSVMSVAGGPQSATDTAASPAGPAGGAETPQPRTPVDIFKVANAGRTATAPDAFEPHVWQDGSEEGEI